MKHDANWCEKTKRTVRARTYCIDAFRCVQGVGGRVSLRLTRLGLGLGLGLD